MITNNFVIEYDIKIMINKIKIGYCTKDVQLADNLIDSDIAIFSSGVFGEISFKNELCGRTEHLSEMGRLSARLDSVCFFGVTTDSYGLIRQSIIACAEGRLIGISDSNRSFDKDQSVSCGYKIYNTKKGKIGVLVDRDICIVDAVKTLASCECDVIIDISRDFTDFKPEIIAQALSYLNGISICFLCKNMMYAVAPSGELVYSDCKTTDIFTLSTKRKFIDYNAKSRGV